MFEEWELFTGTAVEEGGDTGHIGWLDDSRKPAVSRLRAALPALFQSLQLNDQGTWSEYARSVEAELNVPSVVDKKITPFQKVR